MHEKAKGGGESREGKEGGWKTEKQIEIDGEGPSRAYLGINVF